MGKFDLGSRVVIKNVSSDYWFHKETISEGMTGVIIDAYSDVSGIEFDKYIDGHSCDGLGRQGYCYYVKNECLHHISELSPSVNICELI